MSRAMIIVQRESDRQKAVRWAQQAPTGTTIEFKAPRRSLDQNALLWSRLGELSNAIEWHGQRLSSDDWKTLLTASLRQSRFVPGIDPGTVVPLGLRTSDMTKAEMAELLTLIEAFAAERGVTFMDQREDVA